MGHICTKFIDFIEDISSSLPHKTYVVPLEVMSVHSGIEVFHLIAIIFLLFVYKSIQYMLIIIKVYLFN